MTTRRRWAFGAQLVGVAGLLNSATYGLPLGLVGFHFYNTEDDIDRLLDALAG